MGEERRLKSGRQREKKRFVREWIKVVVLRREAELIHEVKEERRGNRKTRREREEWCRKRKGEETGTNLKH